VSERSGCVRTSNEVARESPLGRTSALTQTACCEVSEILELKKPQRAFAHLIQKKGYLSGYGWECGRRDLNPSFELGKLK
jgi:hypothetical protein